MDDLITPISARTDELITLTVLIVGVAAGYGKAHSSGKLSRANRP